MRVDQRNLAGTTGAETSRAEQAQPVLRDGGKRSPGSGAGSGTDQVELSPLSRALSSSAAMRSDRVAKLAARYQGGQYQVDAAQLSQSLVSDALASPKL